MSPQKELLYAQIVASEQRVRTSPQQYGLALRKIMKANPDLTLAQLSAKIDRPIPWILEMMRVPQPCE